MNDDDLSSEQMHIAPSDELDHTMSAFCPCNPVFEMAQTENLHDGTVHKAIVYRHESMAS